MVLIIGKSFLCFKNEIKKMKAREASARFLTQYGVESGGGGVIQTKFEYDTENDIRAVAKGGYWGCGSPPRFQ